MQPLLVINLVGLTRELLGEHTPHLSKFAKHGAAIPIQAALPAVTCTAQATFLTGKPASDHGIVANGWYFKDLSEVMFWKQSNHLVESEKVWDVAKRRDPNFTVANLFWWYNMYSTVDWAVTPRPMYPADGRKLPDVHTQPADLRGELKERFGTFPLFKFWGPAADIESSRWITQAALYVMQTRKPTLQLVYLPHLDYNLQRLGPDLKNPVLQQDLRTVDALAGELIDAAKQQGRRVLVVSEYGITKVDDAVHINRALRHAGWVAIREELGRELLDAGASDAFAVADHQLAHVYVKHKQLIPEVRAVLQKLDGVESVYDKSEQGALGIAHERSGDLVLVSRANRWFSYYYWLDSARAPDFASTVDIHRKPGYDPVELFVDPKLAWPKLAIAWRLLKKAAGFRMLMNVISSEASHIVRGSHGRPTDDPEQGPLLLSDEVTSALVPFLNAGSLPATSVFDVILDALFGSGK